MIPTEFSAWIRSIEPDMIRSVGRLVREPDDAADALQDAQEIILRRRAKVAAHPNPRALVLRICVNAALDHLRRKTIREARRGELPEEVADPAPSPVGEAVSRETLAEIQAALVQLSPQQAEAFTLRAVHGMDYPEVAAALGCAEASARVHIHRARTRLAALLSHLNPLSRARSARLP